MPGHDPKPEPAALKSRHRSRFHRNVVGLATLMAACALLFIVFVTFERERSRRFDRRITTTQAEIIRDEAAEKDDAETWMAIQNEILMPRHLKMLDANTSWTRIPWYVWKSRSFAEGLRQYSAGQYLVKYETSFYMNRQADQLFGKYHPNIIQAVAQWLAEYDRETDPETRTRPELAGASFYADLEMLYETQGRWGEAFDRCWIGFLVEGFKTEKIGHAIQLHVNGSYFLQNDDILKSIDNIFRKNPSDPWMVRFAGLRRWREGKFAEAEPLLARAADLFSDDPEGRYAWAESRLALGLPVDADTVMGPPCRPSIHFETQEAMRLHCRSKLHARLADLPAALADAEAASKLDPRLTESWANLAEIAKKSGDAEFAATAAKKASEWRERDERLSVTIRDFLRRDRSPTSLMKPEIDTTLDSMVRTLRAADWQRPADALELAKRFASREIKYDAMRNRPELKPSLPDRYFQARPVLRSQQTSPAKSP